jgi:hypothetical protein
MQAINRLMDTGSTNAPSQVVIPKKTVQAINKLAGQINKMPLSKRLKYRLQVDTLLKNQKE